MFSSKPNDEKDLSVDMDCRYPLMSKLYLTVFTDGVKIEMDDFFKRDVIGWFVDEVSAVSAACERVMIRSALYPDLRRMMNISVECDYRNSPCNHPVLKYTRGTRIKHLRGNRRVVMTPGAGVKPWLRQPRGV